MKNLSLSNSLKGKGKLIGIAFGILVSAGFVMSINTSKTDHKTILEEITKKQESLDSAKLDQKASVSLGDSNDDTRVTSVARFTGELETLSQTHEVGLSQMTVDAVTRPAPGTATTNPSWVESDISFTIDGGAPQVYSYINDLKNATAKFRILDINLSPKISPGGEASIGVTAVVRLTLLMKSGANS